MEKAYWLGRRRSAVAMARLATTAEARLIHYDLAGRHSIMAAYCPPFMIPKSTPSSEGEQAALHRPAPDPEAPRRPPTIGDPDKPQGKRR